MRRIILASQSPWRRVILRKTGLKFSVKTSGHREDMSLRLPPHKLAQHIALGKAEAVAKRHPNALLIAADTFVIFKGKLLGKPRTRKRAKEMLMALSGRWHEIVTGFVILDSKTSRKISQTISTRVHLRKADESEIAAYVRTGEPLHVAGAYAIQGRAGILVDKIEGDYWNVVGLPLAAVMVALRKFGVRS